MQLSVLQARLLDHLKAVGSATTGAISVACGVRVDQVAASLNSLHTQASAPIRHERTPKSAQYVTWFYTAPEQESQPTNEAPTMTIQLTPLQERLVANILARNHGDARSDVLGKAVGVGPGEVSASLLTLRAGGYIGSANDGGDYNFWFVTPKLREALNQRLAEQRRAEQQRKQEALIEEGKRVAEATKQRLLAQRQARNALVAPAAPGEREIQAIVSSQLNRAMATKGYGICPRPKYILWSPSSGIPPQMQYATKEKADEVAEIMSRRNPGQVFIVCELQAAKVYIQPKPVTPAIHEVQF